MNEAPRRGRVAVLLPVVGAAVTALAMAYSYFTDEAYPYSVGRRVEYGHNPPGALGLGLLDTEPEAPRPGPKWAFTTL